MGDTAISWTDKTWNPIRGCSRVSAGCQRCYAEIVAARFSGPGQPYEGLATMRLPKFGGDNPGAKATAHWTGEVRFIEEHLFDPIRWRKPQRIFVNSMSDLFHEKLSDEQIDRVFGVMAQTPRHTYQVLTKRPERMLAYCSAIAALSPKDRTRRLVASMYRGHPAERLIGRPGDAHTGDLHWPLPNVHLGVSAEDQDTFDQRVELLGRTPAALRFVSLEPLLGPIDLGNFADEEPDTYDPVYGALSWVIVGGESGPGYRPMHLDWLNSIVTQCRNAKVPVWVKQDSGSKPGRQGRILREFWVQEAAR